MGSEVPSQLIDKTNVVVASNSRDCPAKRNHGKVPKKIRKSEREKLKREQLNELFIDLANALELDEQNNGKASIVTEASRLVKDLFNQIGSLKKENDSLLSEFNYVAVEKNELQEENSALQSQIETLQFELKARTLAGNHNPDLNVLPHLEYQLSMAVTDPALQQPHAVFAVPTYEPEVSQMSLKANLVVSKPHARYPTQADSWPGEVLGFGGQRIEEQRGFGLDGGCNN